MFQVVSASDLYLHPKELNKKEILASLHPSQNEAIAKAENLLFIKPGSVVILKLVSPKVSEYFKYRLIEIVGQKDALKAITEWEAGK